MLTKQAKYESFINASGKYQGTSLKENLLPGLDLLNNLISVLTRFRQGKHAVIADIKQMYHLVKVPLVETDALRFLLRDK